MTPVPVPDATASGSPHVENPEAQRAYAASVAPPPRPALEPQAARRARLAGGLGGTGMLLGVDAVGVGVMLLAVPVAIAAASGWLAERVDGAARASLVADLYASPYPWVLLATIALGVALAVAGAVASARVLRRAGCPRPTSLTFGGFGVGVGVRLVLNLFLVPFSSLLAPLAERLGESFAAGGGSALAATLALVVVVLMNVAIASVVGMVSWWWLAHALRPEVVAAARLDPVDVAAARADAR